MKQQSPGWFDALMSALDANANRVAAPKPVDIPRVGKFYVRPRLIAEYSAALTAAEDGDGHAMARGTARLFCGEDGSRATAEQEAQLAQMLGKQPEAVLFAIARVADAAPDGASAAGN